MAFLRRGNCAFPHRPDASVELHRSPGIPVRFKLSDINCWEEYSVKGCLRLICMVYHGLSSTAVVESFEEVSALVNALEVPHA